MEIELRIIHARKIKIGDIKSSDPYIKFKIGNFDYTTTTKKKTLFPNWNEKFKITVFPKDEITFELFDHDTIGKDDYLGIAKYEIPEKNISNSNV